VTSHRVRHLQYVALSVAIVVLIGIFTLTPIYWLVVVSLKPFGTEYTLPMQYYPPHPTLNNYFTVIGGNFDFLQPLLNSIIVSSSVMALALTIAPLSAYAIARLRFKYKVQSLFLLMIGGMVPAIVTLGPTYVLIRAMGLLATLPAMIIPNVFYSQPLCVFLLTTYFCALPFELEDAAKMDGYTPLQIFWRVILPISTPGLFSAGIFAFLGSYGEFMLASIVTEGYMNVATVPIGVLRFSQSVGLQWTRVSAAIMLSLIPVIVIVLVFQKWVIRGLSAGSVKY